VPEPIRVSAAVPSIDTAAERQTMVDCQVRTFDVTDRPIIDRMMDLPRELFVPAVSRSLAYSDVPLRIKSPTPGGETRVMLPPFVIARLLQGAKVNPSDRVLDVASGGGYGAAVVAALANHVVCVESDETLAEMTRANLAAAGVTNVVTRCGALPAGAPGDGPFDLIIVHGGVAQGLDALFAQLAPNGRLVTILYADDQSGRAGKATRFDKNETDVSRRFLFDAGATVLRDFAPAPAFVF
jgi:protein-L-isoaspartate(D-aspartate) O-methyltransferase